MDTKQADCFKLYMKFCTFLGIWPGDNTSRYYKYYSIIFVTFVVILYDILLTINFFFLPRQLDIFIEELIFYFMELAVTSKVLTYLVMRDKLENALDTLECQIFQPDDDEALKFVDSAKRFIFRYWKIVAVVSYTSNLTHVLSPFIAHLFLPVELDLPVCSYSFIPEHIKKTFIYPLWLYQSIGMHCHMLYHINIDAFFLGLMNLTIAQLECLDYKLRRVTDNPKTADEESSEDVPEKEYVLQLELNKCVIHFDEISKFCSLVEEIFSVTLFVQFSMASCIICVCLFRFTLPAPASYYVFLVTYMTVMIALVMVPSWFGTRIMETSSALSVSVYNCDWTSRPRQFKSTLKLFVERMNKPLSIVGLKMFPLSLTTFSKIINSAYSFFTLLRHMQTQES